MSRYLTFDANLQEDHLEFGDKLIDVIYGKPNDVARFEVSVSMEDVETLLGYQVDQMQRMGNRLSQGMQEQFRRMVETGVTIPSLSHYVKFLDSWKAGDYPSSFDSLHRYFDYTMHNRDHFGCYSEAVAAMQETISTARENNDMGCLNYSLSWLYHFGKAHPGYVEEVQRKGVLGTDKEALVFLKAKAKETSMWSLLSTCLLSEAKLALSNGDSVAYAFEGILKSSHLNVMKNVTNAIGSQMSMQSSAFGRLGVTCQSWLSGEIFLQCYVKDSPVEDIVHAVCKAAFLLSQKGRYEEAIARMEEVDEETLRPLRYTQYWTANLGLLKLRRHLHRYVIYEAVSPSLTGRRDNLIAAEHVLSKLRAPLNVSQDLLFSVTILEIDLVVRRGDYSEAMRILERLATKINDDEADIYQRIKVMTLKARIHDKAGIPQKGFSVALRAASLAHRARLLPALWEAVGAISAVLISLKEYNAVAKLLESIMPQVLECEDCNLSAQIFSLLADAHMGLAGESKPETQHRKEQMTKALDNIDRSFDEFSRIEDIKGQCEMMAKKATIMHLNGDPVLANDCAAKYLDIKRAAKDRL
ncbi:anaphase-promoting complex subunit 5, partial [Lecanoromycetidae sp. Uapishka_2]